MKTPRPSPAFHFVLPHPDHSQLVQVVSFAFAALRPHLLHIRSPLIGPPQSRLSEEMLNECPAHDSSPGRIRHLSCGFSTLLE